MNAPSVYLEVAFPIPLDKTFHYAWPDTLRCDDPIGRRVRAPFGPGKLLQGVVVGQTIDSPPFKTKPIHSWIDEEPVLSPAMLRLTDWVRDRYLCSWGDAIACAWPSALAAPRRVTSTTTARTEERRQKTEDGGQRTKGMAPSSVLPPLSSPFALTADQSTALTALLPSVRGRTAGAFLLHGVTDSGKTEVYLRAMDEALDQHRQALYLLPEIAMTPPFFEQLKARYGASRVALWHSALAPGERYRVWTGCRQGTLQVLLGARSAVFAPFPDLGVLIVDEEHEPAYKQEDRPRYHTRDVALQRAQFERATVLLGSATPSLESYRAAQRGAITLLSLPERVEQRALPRMIIINRGVAEGDAGPDGGEKPAEPVKKKRRGSPGIFSEPLKLALEQRLARREQAMLFVNRRGFTPFLRCGGCGWVARCSRCSLTMAVHLASTAQAGGPSGANRAFPPPADTALVCHACLRREKAPVECPSCHTLKLRLFGIGTQRIERELQTLFPFVKISRLDSDVGRSRSRLEHEVRAFARGETDVLIGTQMIAKGFDFPRVTLVGVVDADVSLHLPDFRAAERTFNLLVQVAGRSGRGQKPGTVLIQTHFPDHPALVAARTHDYVGFYKREIQEREALGYPPFKRLIRVLIRARSEEAAMAAAEKAIGLLPAGPGLEILGPAPAAHLKVRGHYRVQILIKGTDDAALSPLLPVLRRLRLPKAHTIVDVDPQDLL